MSDSEILNSNPYEAGQLVMHNVRPNYYELGASVGSSSVSLELPKDAGILTEVSARVDRYKVQAAFSEDKEMADSDTFIYGVFSAVLTRRLHEAANEGRITVRNNEVRA